MKFQNSPKILIFLLILASIFQIEGKYSSLNELDTAISSQITIYSYSPDNLTELDTFSDIDVNPNVLIVVTHGFTGSCDGPNSRTESKAFYTMEDKMAGYFANIPNSLILCLDWSPLAGDGGNNIIDLIQQYKIASTSIEPIALYVAEFIQIFQGSEIIFDGHSLGAHLIGRISSQFRKIAQTSSIYTTVFAQDPAGPSFAYPILDTFRGLQKDDAHFTQVVHSSWSYGSSIPAFVQNLGHVNFFVNAISPIQPFCKTSCAGFPDLSFSEDPGWQRCSHIFSGMLAVEAIGLGPNPQNDLGFVGCKVKIPFVPFICERKGIFGKPKLLRMGPYLKKPDSSYFGSYYLCTPNCPNAKEQFSTGKKCKYTF